MSISEQTLAYAESAFSTETSFAELLKHQDHIIFRIVSEIKMGHQLWKEPAKNSSGVATEKGRMHIFRPEDKSKAKQLKEPNDADPKPFIFFCAYFPAKKNLQIVKVNQSTLFKDIIATYRKFLPEDVYSFATCRVQKNIVGNNNCYAFELVTTLDSNFTTQVARSEPPEECKELLKFMPFNLEKIYDRQDAFDV